MVYYKINMNKLFKKIIKSSIVIKTMQKSKCSDILEDMLTKCLCFC